MITAFDRHQQRRIAVGAGVGALALAAAAAIPVGSVEDGPVLCPLRNLTGLPCPGCGLTRSWVYLAHGHWSDAVAANPFGIVTFAAALVLIGVVAVSLVRRSPVPRIGDAIRQRVTRLVTGVWIAFGALRLVAVALGP